MQQQALFANLILAKDSNTQAIVQRLIPIFQWVKYATQHYSFTDKRRIIVSKRHFAMHSFTA
ncbi:hypothetical protein QWZ13_15070 [Reinekea marina]|uniref:hypothetical protein n=1 Tax=Reinekea marina TaxID=1310421 RepID=UPI0025B5DE28|nr:hypothetical protein [Reinekea marina]MDN3650239.1 hypothetical protein [Reinekea marina]